jgi:DNA mismatch repair protein MutL
MVEVEQQAGPLNISGMAALPSLSRPNADQVYLFINRRFVRDKVLLHAITQAYSDIMPHDRKPVAILHIELDPALVDVNVHPAKTEVRFRDSSIVHQALRHSLRSSLSQNMTVVPDEIPAEAMAGNEDSGAGFGLPSNTGETVSQVSDSAINYFNYSRSPLRGGSGGAQRGYGSSRDYSVKRVWQASLAAAAIPGENARNQEIRDDNYSLSEIFGQKSDLLPLPMFKPVDDVRIVGQMHNLYILASAPSGLFIIDQHAAYERLNYEKLKSALSDGVAPGQPLLKPHLLDLSPQEYALAVEAAPAWLRLGLELVEFGPATLAIQAVPAHWIGQAPGPLLQQLMAEIALVDVDTPEFLENSLRSMACKRSVLQGQHLSPPAMQDLVSRLFKLPPPLTCPHGRPVVLTVESRDLLHAFQRV